MSHFIAHTITFSKDLKTFKLKGGDNNIVPRSNVWSGEIPIDSLYYNLNGGMVRLNGTAEKNCFIRSLVSKYEFGGDWENNTNYYTEKNKEVESSKLKNFDMRFILELVSGLKRLSNKKEYIITLNGDYIYKVSGRHAKTTLNHENALKYGKYRAMEIAKDFKNHFSEIVKI